MVDLACCILNGFGCDVLVALKGFLVVVVVASLFLCVFLAIGIIVTLTGCYVQHIEYYYIYMVRGHLRQGENGYCIYYGDVGIYIVIWTVLAICTCEEFGHIGEAVYGWNREI